MTDTLVPVKAAPTQVAATDPRKLDEVLLAMDVVDTLRHRTQIVDQELNAEAREEQLIARLKEIYGAQGIEVPDKILKDGVKALEEQRFNYKPPENTFSVKLAKLYVSRGQWLPAATTFTFAVVALVAGWQLFWAMPQAAEAARMPAEITRLLAEGQGLAVDPAVDQRLAGIAAEGQRDIANGKQGDAREQVALLKNLNEQLASQYDLRIVYAGGETSGFYRRPPNNPSGRNYYLIVEPVAPGGRVLTVPVINEETQKTEQVTRYAQRVTKETWDKVFEDKAPDLIIQNDILGHKDRGALEPVFDAPTPGGVITKW